MTPLYIVISHPIVGIVHI